MKQVGFAPTVTVLDFEAEEPTTLLFDTELHCLGYHKRDDDVLPIQTKLNDGPSQAQSLVHDIIKQFHAKRQMSRSFIARHFAAADGPCKQEALTELRMLHRRVVEKGCAHLLPSRTKLTREWRYALCFIAAAMALTN
jgi:hypothetical protein